MRSTPHRVATLCGLTCRSDSIPQEQLRGLPPEAAALVAQAARLTVPEVQADSRSHINWLTDNLAAADLRLEAIAVATLDAASDMNPASYPHGPFGSVQRSRAANGPEALGELVETHANASDPAR